MRSFAIATLVIGIVVPTAFGQQTLTPAGSQASSTDPASYGIGYDIGSNIAAGGIAAEDIKKEDLLAGILDALAGKEPTVNPDLIRNAMQQLGMRIMARKKAASAKFLEDNKKKDGVQVTESGLQYEVLKSGNGATPTPSSTVSVHYEGKLINGNVFDSSIQRGQPYSTPVTEVIAGWTEALLRMKVGDRWRLVIPSNLAYGEQGFPPAIGPNETLVFEVELLEVK